jgi:hypothetical protein|tara:strand:+ start:3542 stop:3778 length:237 start_codon:yes stop_codon:yes gene_type:complete
MNKTKTLIPIINTKVSMTEKMMDALCVLECKYVQKPTQPINEKIVKDFLTEKYNNQLAQEFQTKFLINIPGSSIVYHQ